jgi:hypothetical protein
VAVRSRLLELYVGLLGLLHPQLQVHYVGGAVPEGHVPQQDELLAQRCLALGAGSDVIDPYVAFTALLALLLRLTLLRSGQALLLLHSKVLGDVDFELTPGVVGGNGGEELVELVLGQGELFIDGAIDVVDVLGSLARDLELVDFQVCRPRGVVLKQHFLLAPQLSLLPTVLHYIYIS